MAKPSKQRPWIVEIRPPGTSVHTPEWFEMDAFRDAETAEANANLMRRRSPDAEFRVIHINRNDRRA